MTKKVTLADMLLAREERVKVQQALLADYPSSLICFTMNIAGPIKNGSLIRSGFHIGLSRLKKSLSAAGYPITAERYSDSFTGCEAFWAVAAPPRALKAIAVSIEDGSKLGRLFDIDVLKSDGVKVGRRELGYEGRRCLLCGKPAPDCASRRTHSAQLLWQRTQDILRSEVAEEEERTVSGLAQRALLYEVCITPKPGLVDRRNSGSHKDMDIFTFLDSATALRPYFAKCFRIGRESRGDSPQSSFAKARQLGIAAEQDMLVTTGGVNTHKGAIFSMGIVCTALGRLWREQWQDIGLIAAECSAMTKGICAEELPSSSNESLPTAGQKLYHSYGIRGVRGQLEDGLPDVLRTGLPVLIEGLRRGLGINQAGCGALLALIVVVDDTNLIARGGYELARAEQHRIMELLRKDPYPSPEQLCQLDDDFIRKNLSPGGCADLLALCFFFHFLKEACPWTTP